MITWSLSRALKALAAWIDKRFPEKVVVSNEDFDSLQREQMLAKGQVRDLWETVGLLKVRITVLENGLAGVKDLLAKGGLTAVKTEADKLRDNFVRGEFARTDAT